MTMKMDLIDNKLKVVEPATQESLIFNQLLEYKKTVFCIYLGYSKDYADAEDLVQEIYLKVYLNVNRLKDTTVKKEWLFKIARNTCLDYLRKKPRFSTLSLEDATEAIEWKTPESLTTRKEQYILLKNTVLQLPKKLRDIFVLKEYGSLSYEEIAAILKIKPGTVMSRLNRARQAVIRRTRRKIHGNQ